MCAGFLGSAAAFADVIEYWRPGSVYGLYDINEPYNPADEYAQYTYYYRARNRDDAIKQFINIRNKTGLGKHLPISNQRIEDSKTLLDSTPILMEWRDLYETWAWYRPDMTKVEENDERPADAFRSSSYAGPALGCYLNQYAGHPDVWACQFSVRVKWLKSLDAND